LRARPGEVVVVHYLFLIGLLELILLIACKLEDSLRFLGVKDILTDIVDKGTMTEIK